MPADENSGQKFDTPPLKPFSKAGSNAPPKQPAQTFRSEVPRRVVEIPGNSPSRSMGASSDDANRLIVGQNIRLRGEIAECAKLIVEGHIEASISEAQLLEIAPTGQFKGTAEVHEADISGHFDGTLVATEKLTVRQGGKVTGSVRYGRIVIESGGEISGDMASIKNGDDIASLVGRSRPPMAPSRADK
jgi:cytoskeletal protein CcmA (bactofilin family)